jgi:serine/threonine protein kinase
VADADACIGGRYRLDAKIAAGGMGTVWQGWDTRLRRPVAVKQVRLESWLPEAEREVAVARMMREARNAARLRHPNAVQVYDVVDDADSPCLIMEHVPSRSLQQIVAEQGPLAPEDAARIGTQVAAALAAAHRAGVVHRDVKPGNVLIAEDGSAKITDFGISHAYDDISLTSTGMLTGTPAFLAPEVARGAAASFASDVYSLGATLYMAVEGRPPFGTDDNAMAVLHRVASGHWEQPQRGGTLTPILARMMSADPAARPTMVEVAMTLPDLHALAPEPSADSPTQVLPPPRTAAPAAASPAGDTRTLAAPAPAGSRPGPALPRRQRSWSWPPIAAALAVVALGIVVAIVLLAGGGAGDHTAAGDPGSAGSPTTRSSAGTTPTSAPTTRSTAPTSRSGATPTSRSGAAPTAEELARAVRDYFNLVPGNLDAGWVRLTSHFQRTRAQGRQSYEDYWNSVAWVDVRAARGDPPHTATATLVYHYKDGEVVTQQTQFRFVRQDGLLKIGAES